ncbi:hypothetical protein HDV01_005339 [Terramyces sp. JEL0728]|nr:hypothetical protein HDV01_005321 [Terramyces sp. JEL0728]KAJ3272703.1 hypothetical protein HDV01_005339 [Terramyces sp. JEL0728]
MSEFPQYFLDFLKENEIDSKEYSYDKIPRYFRLKDAEIEGQLDFEYEKLEWFNGFYKTSASTNIASLDVYRNGLLYGLDVTSGVAARALDVQPNDQILDICCAPGSKLCYLADLLGEDSTGTITGVDISKERLFTCKSLIQKYKLGRARLFLCDGTSFNVPSPTRVGPNVLYPELKKRKHQEDNTETHGKKVKGQNEANNTIKPFHATRLIRDDPQVKGYLYDKVIVDAECTHDGSIAHMRKYFNNGWQGFQEQFLNPERLSGLQKLQRSLLQNGFHLLKSGGILIYSTCSFSPKQNEEIVDWFLKTNLNADCIPIGSAEEYPTAPLKTRIEFDARIKNCLRFSPKYSQTSGLFIAKIRKT